MLNITCFAEIGNPPQNVSLFLSIFASWTWLPSLNCSSCHQTYRFNDSLSTSFQNIGTEIAVHYFAEKSIKGTLGKDTITFNGLTSKNQDFILINEMENLEEFVSDGVLGLGFSVDLESKPNFVENLKAQGEIDQAVFSLYLSSINSSVEPAFTIGGYDELTYGIGDCKTIDIQSDNERWISVLDDISFNGKGFKSVAHKVIFTSSYTLFIVGPELEINYLRNITSLDSKNCSGNDEAFNCECEEGKYERFPEIEFKISGENFIIYPKSYIRYTSGRCYVQIQSNQYDYWVLGLPFLKEFYTVFDMDNKKMHLWIATKHQKSFWEKIWINNYLFNNYWLIFTCYYYSCCIILFLQKTKKSVWL